MMGKQRLLFNLTKNKKITVLFEKYFSDTTATNNNEKTTHFGYKTVKEDDKVKEVYTVFEKVANSYDKMNDAMSFGIHRIWKDIFIQRLGPTHGSKLLDSAGGTGDITFRYLNYLKNIPNHQGVKSCVTVCDINENMLEVGKVRAKKLGWIDQNDFDIEWMQCDAEKLPFQDDSYDAYTIAFGIRNVTHIEKVLSEAYRVLTPGGCFMCLEFSHVDNNILKWFYDQYSFQIIPVLGTLIAGEWQPYQYLVESIRKFPKQEEFKQLIEAAGFRNVTHENLTCGVVAIHSGFKL
ncbi:2-hexaprenyl-6-methoxy-1,4-benzoquinone methyltransferase [Melipona bicolor]|uniref:2-methoxy-6-polyprenyl-1,4-benzoquinol methylase, mitochondrial n=1 Tax=Melipona bicolor TaxID=60889 RepID=A0AA40KU09_9HYME|nr:2-hexaprenyl-6-methoxy-1,4-benzoquinone methyltransferase [Melipona bicolor]